MPNEISIIRNEWTVNRLIWSGLLKPDLAFTEFAGQKDSYMTLVLTQHYRSKLWLAAYFIFFNGNWFCCCWSPSVSALPGTILFPTSISLIKGDAHTHSPVLISTGYEAVEASEAATVSGSSFTVYCLMLSVSPEIQPFADVSHLKSLSIPVWSKSGPIFRTLCGLVQMASPVCHVLPFTVKLTHRRDHIVIII